MIGFFHDSAQGFEFTIMNATTRRIEPSSTFINLAHYFYAVSTLLWAFICYASSVKAYYKG